MKPAITSRLGLIGLVASVLLLASCGKTDKGGGFVPTDLPSDGGGGGGGGTAPVAGLGFAVSVPTTYEGNSFMHLFNDPDSPCEIPLTATTPQEISCLANVPETDLFMSGLPLSINYPAGFCKYSGRSLITITSLSLAQLPQLRHST